MIPVRGREPYRRPVVMCLCYMIPVRGRKPILPNLLRNRKDMIPIRGQNFFLKLPNPIMTNVIPVRGQKIPHRKRCGIFLLFSLNFACAVARIELSGTSGTAQTFSLASFAFRQDVL